MDHEAARRRRRHEQLNPHDNSTNDYEKLVVDNGSVSVQNDAKLRRKRQKSRRKRKRPHYDGLSIGLLAQVGSVVFVIMVSTLMAIQWMIPQRSEYDDDGYGDVVEEHVEVSTNAPKQKAEPTPMPLPIWELSNFSKFDAYGIAESLQIQGHLSNNNKAFWEEAKLLRNDFSERFGGENSARAILQRGISAFGNVTDSQGGYPSDLMHTACRIRESRKKGTFSMAFGGYSVTAGRGNFFQQSYPFVLQDVLKRAFKLLGIALEVRNAAIGSIGGFPYGWCMTNFWGVNVDVVSWDYSMNEPSGAAGGLEAYLRQVTALGNNNPKLLVKDTHLAKPRRDILRRYVKEGVIVDPMVIHTDPAVEFFLNLPEESRPSGFQEWRRFGAPPGAPGQAYHHPAVKEHEFIGWITAMHFLGAMELAAADEDYPLDCASLKSKKELFAPFTKKAANVPWSSLFYGIPENRTSPQGRWKLNPIHCRTSYEPILGGDLSSLIVSGTAGDDVELMLPKGPMFYNKGWVLDLGEKEKLAKRKLDRFGGLGFVDSKKAYYGIRAAGPLRMLLPYESKVKGALAPRIGDEAVRWFSSIVVCEANEKRDDTECKAEKHMTFVVGGVEAAEKNPIDSDGTLYLGKKLCMHITVPKGAKISSSRDMREKSSARFDEEEDEGDAVGLPLEVSVNDIHIHDKKNACSVSHVVWELSDGNEQNKR